MTTPEALKAQIESTQDLQSVVKTMKALAAVSIHQYEAAISALQQYSHTLELGLQILLQQQRGTAPTLAASPRSQPDRLGLIVFGSDQGLCGQFNQQITQHLNDYLGKSPAPIKRDHRVAVVGARPLPLIADQGITVDGQLPMPTSVSEISGTVQDLLLLINRWRSPPGHEQPWPPQNAARSHQTQRILLFYNRPLPGATFEPHIDQLLPLDHHWLDRLQTSPWSGRCLPTVFMATDDLFSALVQQVLFIGLYRAMAASLASENASRLAAMQSAERNIRDRLTDLTGDYRQQRQDAITAELLDVVSGFEALTDPP